MAGEKIRPRMIINHGIFPRRATRAETEVTQAERPTAEAIKLINAGFKGYAQARLNQGDNTDVMSSLYFFLKLSRPQTDLFSPLALPTENQTVKPSPEEDQMYLIGFRQGHLGELSQQVVDLTIKLAENPKDISEVAQILAEAKPETLDHTVRSIRLLVGGERK